jgi:aminopeptidase N
VSFAERDGRTVRIFHRESNTSRFEQNRAALTDQHAHALRWMEEYTDTPYPFEKLDLVLIPSFQFNGMEHPGALFYNADTVLLDPTATQSRHLARAHVIAHETAHLWFGDLVTMRWFDDVWMKEVMANFMAAKIVNPSFPDVNHDLRFLLQHYPAAYEVDRTDGANPIRQPLGNLNEAGALYGAIIYQKAPIVLRQLEMLMGVYPLRDGLREFLRTYAFGNAGWPDLIRLLDPRTEHDLAAWSRAWIEEAGRPSLSTDLHMAGDVIEELTVRQSDARGRDLTWPQRLQVLLGYGASVRAFDVTLDGAEATVHAAACLPAPDWVLPLGGGRGYGDVRLDSRTLAFLTTSTGAIENPITRAAALVTRWEAMLGGQLPPRRVFDALLTELPREREELILQLLLDQTRTLFWRFVEPAGRSSAAARLEPVLRSGLEAATTTSAKAAWFQAARATAVTADAVGWLESVWSRRVAIRGLPLSETDETDLAFDLAIRLPDRAAGIIDTQTSRVSDADRRARITFIGPVLSGDASARAVFFQGLSDVQARRRESWVIDALRYLHHPLRAESSRALVVPALSMLRDVERTGDIFFPKRWADAALSGYQSRDVAADVRAFLDSLPLDYPTRLRWVLLSSADPLFRAAATLETP